MEIKRNDATLLRPEGDRVLDAPYVFMNFDEFRKQVKDEEAWKKRDRNGITIFKTDNLTTVLTCLHKDASIKKNTVDGLFQVQVLEGKIRKTVIIFHDGMTIRKDNGFIPGVLKNNL